MSDPSHFGDAHRPLQARAGESPDRIDLPFWLDACLLLDPPMRNGKPRAARHAIYPVARALLADRIRVRGDAGDAAVPLDRAALARWAGYVDYKKAAWIFDYLQRIGFLEIHKHWTKGGRRPDTFDVFITPPANYVGPTTYAELNAALRAHGRGEPVRLWIQQNRSSEPRFPGEHHGPDPRFPGEHHGSENRSSEPRFPGEHHGPDPRFPGEHHGSENRSSEPRFPGEHHASDREISDLDREIGDRSERDAARGAGAVVVAPAEEDELTTAVQELVQRLPWESTRKGRTASVMSDAQNRLVPAIVSVVRAGHLTLEDAKNLALRKLAEAKTSPVSYLVCGFRPDNLPLPPPEDVLPLPGSEPSTPEADQRSEAGPQEQEEQPPAASDETRASVMAFVREISAQRAGSARRRPARNRRRARHWGESDKSA